jgi:membrane-bound lytic murein transglycosylase D
MEKEQDPDKLEELQAKIDTLSGNAEKAIENIGKKNKKKAAEVVESGDDLDKEIRRILKSFDAQTYAVPPVFKERLQAAIDALVKAPERKSVYRRKQKYWDMILREFSALGLPEEMAYIAWAESRFDPEVASPAGALGMWQLTPDTARAYKLKVEKHGVDERRDPEKATKAAARYLANLLAEFGSDSFMLAMASYNRGESGVRRVLHQIAQEKDGFRKEKRDFWHLYRLKKLPDETREYVPRILAAAVVCHAPEKYGLE